MRSRIHAFSTTQNTDKKKVINGKIETHSVNIKILDKNKKVLQFNSNRSIYIKKKKKIYVHALHRPLSLVKQQRDLEFTSKKKNPTKIPKFIIDQNLTKKKNPFNLSITNIY